MAVFFGALLRAPAASSFYWEESKTIASVAASFPRVATNGHVSYVLWQEPDVQNKRIWLSCRTQDADGSWREHLRFAGPLAYSGEVPDLYSAAVSASGTLAVAVLSGTNSISVFVSTDQARSFTRRNLPQQKDSLVAPSIFCMPDGTFRLFTSLSKRTSDTGASAQAYSFYLYEAESSDGLSWSQFSEFKRAAQCRNPFAPTLCSSPAGVFMIFQAQLQQEKRLSYQLYLCHSVDNGATWTEPTLLTSFSAGKTAFSMLHNQRPAAAVFQGKVFVAWERRSVYSDSDSIWLMQINKDGRVSGTEEEIAGKGNARRAQLFDYDNALGVVWFDTRSGFETVYMAQKNGTFWDEFKLSGGGKSVLFAFPLFFKRANALRSLSFVWQENRKSGDTSGKICWLSPDSSVLPPKITALNHKAGGASRQKKATYRIALPADSSNIAGFSYSWSQDPDVQPAMSENDMKFPSENTLSLTAEAEGIWRLKVRAHDYAGNWSESAEADYVLDLTPPKPPEITVTKATESAFLSSNTFAIDWKTDEADTDVKSFIYSWERVASVPLSMAFNGGYRPSEEKLSSYAERLLANNKTALEKSRPLGAPTTATSLYLKNVPNGLYVFSAAAIDGAGNVGMQTHLPVLLNRYVPVTAIARAEKKVSVFGDVSLSLYGSDFLYGGTVQKVFVDRDGKAPYDMVLDAHSFTVASNTKISGIELGSELEQGAYYAGIIHSRRGRCLSRSPILTIESSGTVKIEPDFKYVPAWRILLPHYKYRFGLGETLAVSAALILFIVCVGFAYSFIKTAEEIYKVRELVGKVRKGELMDAYIQSLEANRKAEILQTYRRKGSLRYQMIGFTVSLVILVTLLVTVFLASRMLHEQYINMLQGLQNRTDVLFSSMASGVRTFMPEGNVLELSELPPQTAAVPEVEFATVTGYAARLSSENKNSILYVWATNDGAIGEKMNKPLLSAGATFMVSEQELEIERRCIALNEKAAEKFGLINEQIERLNKEYAALSAQRGNGERLKEIQVESQQLRSNIKEEFERIARENEGSIPDFKPYMSDSSFAAQMRTFFSFFFPHVKGGLDETHFLFYRPVLYRSSSSQEFVRGIIFLKVDTSSFAEQLAVLQQRILYIAGIISLAAIALGIFGAALLADVIVRPLKKLEAFVGTIAAEKHKEKLGGEEKNIRIRRNDEIGSLGNSVNRLKEELARAAREENLQNDGKAVQKAFLPLQKLAQGGQQTIASFEDDKIMCFGYYEGASAVSGDYFDYKKLDSRWYVFIKCDASGHGVPAGLIMTVVATLFRRYFDGWSFAKNGIHLDALVMQINDLIESIGLKGKFATIIVCLFDSSNGDVYMCNAGDSIVHVYDDAEKSIKTIRLFETPAAGPLPSFMVEMKGGFRVEKINLKKGDVLFLYTDGIEESTRLFRDTSFRLIKCAEVLDAADGMHGTHSVGSQSEQLEFDRIKEIAEAVFNKRKFVLKKYHSPEPSEVLEFDFSSCAGSVEDCVIALASVEKVFRMYKSPAATASDTVQVDRRIDLFLKEHFNLASKYCIAASGSEDAGDGNYVYYSFLMEDEQTDDLTLLAVRRR